MSKGVEGGKFKAPEPESKRARYLEYIITHVTDPWIDKFLDEWKLEMKRSYGWVQELRKIEDDMVLLRLAAELGFAKKVEYQAPINHETISLGKEVVYAESGRKPKKGVSRDTEKENG